MNSIDSSRFVDACNNLINLNCVMQSTQSIYKKVTGQDAPDFNFVMEDFDRMLEEAQWLEETLTDMGLNSCLISARRLTNRLRLAKESASGNDSVVFDADTKQAISMAVTETFGRVRDDFNSVVLLVVPPLKAVYYEESEASLGPEVRQKFPNAVYEIDEAGKCYALGRYSATVFHLMRVMEYGLRAVNSSLGLANPLNGGRSWGSILGDLTKETKRRDELKPRTWKNKDREFFQEIIASVDAVRNPWRNATMHVENKYTEEEAGHIFVAVKGFMMKLASRCDEQGEPKA